MAQLVHCPACDRHVLATERACPFCEAAMPEAAMPEASGGTGRALTRAAILFAGATALTACSSEPVALYGPAPVDGSAMDSAKDGEPVALYGPAPVDAGSDANQMKDANTSDVVVLYGPAPTDAGNG
jgi:hypothetical protein